MIESNMKEIIAGLLADVENIDDAADREFQEFIEGVSDEFRRDVSGRRADDMGLNIRTGTLLNSIDAANFAEPGSVTFAVFNQGANYWAYHQDGSGRNPKRLNWLEEWDSTIAERVEFTGEKVLEAIR